MFLVERRNDNKEWGLVWNVIFSIPLQYHTSHIAWTFWVLLRLWFQRSLSLRHVDVLDVYIKIHPHYLYLLSQGPLTPSTWLFCIQIMTGWLGRETGWRKSNLHLQKIISWSRASMPYARLSQALSKAVSQAKLSLEVLETQEERPSKRLVIVTVTP